MGKKKISTEKLSCFERHLYADEKSDATVDKYMRDVLRFAKFVGDETIDKELVMAYKSSLKKEYALSSANSMLAAVNGFLRFAGWQDCCVKQFKIQRCAFCSAEQELTKEEYLRLIRTAEKNGNERLSLLLQTLAGTGIRIGELPYITVEAAHLGSVDVFSKAKSRKVFIVPLLKKKLLYYAKKLHIKTGPIFITQGGKPLHRSNIWREMKFLCSRAGVLAKKVFPHNLRHLFAKTFYRQEKDIVKLADILGHSSINTTRIYIVTNGTEHRRKIEAMHLVM